MHHEISHTQLKLHVLGSGSKGNAALVENTATGQGVLIDCGICKRDVFAHAQEVGFDLKNLVGILITHEHTDHTKGLGVTLRGLAKLGIHVPLFTSTAVACNSGPIQEVMGQELVDYHPFVAGNALSLGGMQVHVFPTSHDAVDSFGFRIEAGEDALGYLTDSGIVTPEAHDALQDVRILALESNHDPRMLKEGPYPYHVKQRIASARGHLSNQQSAAELELLLSHRLEHVVAMHISENNNTYRLPHQTLADIVARNGHSATVQPAFQKLLVSVS